MKGRLGQAAAMGKPWQKSERDALTLLCLCYLPLCKFAPEGDDACPQPCRQTLLFVSVLPPSHVPPLSADGVGAKVSMEISVHSQ